MTGQGNDDAEWSDKLDALSFPVPNHAGRCVMHRLAFRALLAVEPQRDACLAYFTANKAAFLSAATTKITRLALPADRSLHINSRDLRRAITPQASAGPARSCRVLDR